MPHKISVIMPSFNYGQFLDSALNSIWRQDISVHEVVIVDVGSTDETLSIIDKHINLGRPIYLVSIPKASPAIARNIGIKKSTGDLVSFLDADDIWPQGKLCRQVQYLDLHLECQMVSGYICYFEKEDSKDLVPDVNSRTETIFHVHVGACLYRKSCFALLGDLFDEEFLFAEDVDLLLRLRESGLAFAILRSVELYYRLHSNSMMAEPHPRKASDFRLAAYKSLRRRRISSTLSKSIPDFSTYLVPPNE
jgi:glycosyltransferase involved in cell wall biosynthesis